MTWGDVWNMRGKAFLVTLEGGDGLGGRRLGFRRGRQGLKRCAVERREVLCEG